MFNYRRDFSEPKPIINANLYIQPVTNPLVVAQQQLQNLPNMQIPIPTLIRAPQLPGLLGRWQEQAKEQSLVDKRTLGKNCPCKSPCTDVGAASWCWVSNDCPDLVFSKNLLGMWPPFYNPQIGKLGKWKYCDPKAKTGGGDWIEKNKYKNYVKKVTNKNKIITNK